jgi:hypothetical protein
MVTRPITGTAGATDPASRPVLGTDRALHCQINARAGAAILSVRAMGAAVGPALRSRGGFGSPETDCSGQPRLNESRGFTQLD